jgi:hypothetical protein
MRPTGSSPAINETKGRTNARRQNRYLAKRPGYAVADDRCFVGFDARERR